MKTVKLKFKGFTKTNIKGIGIFQPGESKPVEEQYAKKLAKQNPKLYEIQENTQTKQNKEPIKEES
jgi:hypothetical protein